MELKFPHIPSSHAQVWLSGNENVMSFLFHIHSNAIAKSMDEQILIELSITHLCINYQYAVFAHLNVYM